MGLTKKTSTGTPVSLSQCNLQGHSITIDAKQDMLFAFVASWAQVCVQRDMSIVLRVDACCVHSVCSGFEMCTGNCWVLCNKAILR